jgi:RNA polymerase sigma factor (sigma-70 family)
MNQAMGNAEADYDEWFRACFPRAVAVARRVVGIDGAEDAAVEAFAAAYARWKRVGALAWRDGWVCRTAFHQALAQARHTGRRPEAPAAPLSVEDGVVLRASMVQALRRLPRRQREAVALRYLIDLPEREVAAVLGVSAGSVKVHLHRGLAALRATLGPDSWEERPDVLAP